MELNKKSSKTYREIQFFKLEIAGILNKTCFDKNNRLITVLLFDNID